MLLASIICIPFETELGVEKTGHFLSLLITSKFVGKVIVFDETTFNLGIESVHGQLAWRTNVIKTPFDTSPLITTSTTGHVAASN